MIYHTNKQSEKQRLQLYIFRLWTVDVVMSESVLKNYEVILIFIVGHPAHYASLIITLTVPLMFHSVPSVISFQEYYTDDIISNMSFPLQLLWIILLIGKQGRHMEHYLYTSPVGIHRT